MYKRSRAKDTALLRTQANKKMLNFATKRILRDLQEIKDETIPTVGVAARPLDKNVFIWHANIQGPKDTIYEGGVFHLEIQLPESYPHQAPKIKLLTSFPHPNVFDEYICLDILDSEREKGRGWSSGYTIQSILIQLQSFLFEKQYEEEEQKYNVSVKKAVKKANDFQCPDCKHGGKISAWPEFSKVEKDIDQFIIHDFNESNQFSKEVLCYHTKLSFKDINQEGKDEPLKGVQLGIGLNVTKVPRTGALNNALPALDYISIKAFVKEGVRKSVFNQSLTHWLPVYFGNEDNKERAIKLTKRAMSFIMANNTKRFTEDMVLEVYPKILISIILSMVDEKNYSSIAIIRIIAHIQANFLMFLEEYPRLQDEVEKKLQEFINNPEKRTKTHTPNLSVLLAYLLVAPKTSFQDLISTYHSESFDRQIFWILKSVPELIEEGQNNLVNQERANLIFKAQQTSYHILCVFKNYISITRSLAKSPKELLQLLNSNYSKFPLKIENEIQNSTKCILQEINDFNSFYRFLGLKEKTIPELNTLMVNAIKQSKEKGYHGKMEEMHKIPTSEDQIQTLLKEVPKPEDFYNATQIEIEIEDAEDKKKQKHEYKIDSKQNLSEQEYKDLCCKRWSWINDQMILFPDISSTKLAELSLEILITGEIEEFSVKKSRIFTKIENGYNQEEIVVQKPKIPLPQQSWQQLFFKLDLEETLKYFNQNPDFTTFYKKLEIIKSYITVLNIPVIASNNIKSGYHFWTQLLTSLTNIKFLSICGNTKTNSCLPLKALKCLQKGFNNFIQNGGSLDQIAFTSFNASGSSAEITDKIFSPMVQMKDLISITFQSTNILAQANASKSFSNIITNLKNLQELVLTTNVITNLQQAKEIADGLMRAKKLKYFDLSNNNYMGFTGFGSVLYNLAFAVNLIYLNVSGCNQSSGGTIADVVESLYKLLKINGSIEILDLSRIPNLNGALTKDFCIYLGDSKTLKSINLAMSGDFSSTSIEFLGKAIAFNHKKQGVLEYIDMTQSFQSIRIIDSFYSAMHISPYDEEIWYGDQLKAGKMTGSDHDKTFYNNLKALQFNKCAFTSNFNIRDFEKYPKTKEPSLLKLIARSNNLVSLQFKGCNLNKKDADLLSLALDSNREHHKSNIKVLNLSKNNLEKEGCKILAKILEKNNTIENLDISKNKIGVKGAQEIAVALASNKTLKFLNLFNNKIGYDGAKALGITLETNTTLQFIEFGHNRIRNKGLLAIADGLEKNTKNSVQVLGLKFNFLSEDGVSDFLKAVKDSTKLKEIYIKNNSIGEFGLFQLKKTYDNLGIKTQVDIFDKLPYLNEERLEKTIYVHPVPGSEQQIKTFFEIEKKCGIIIDIRLRKGPKWPNRIVKPNYFAMIEFADATSTIKALNIASTKKAIIAGSKFRVYKAGTGTYIYQKKTANQKQAETSKTNFVVPTAQTLKKLKLQ